MTRLWIPWRLIAPPLPKGQVLIPVYRVQDQVLASRNYPISNVAYLLNREVIIRKDNGPEESRVPREPAFVIRVGKTPNEEEALYVGKFCDR